MPVSVLMNVCVCKHCYEMYLFGFREQLRLLAEKEFISRKLKLITEPSILKRLEEHIINKEIIYSSKHSLKQLLLSIAIASRHTLMAAAHSLPTPM